MKICPCGKSIRKAHCDLCRRCRDGEKRNRPRPDDLPPEYQDAHEKRILAEQARVQAALAAEDARRWKNPNPRPRRKK